MRGPLRDGRPSASPSVASRRRLDGVSVARKRVDPEARSARTVPSIRISLGQSISAAGATLGAGCATPSCAQGANARGELELELGCVSRCAIPFAPADLVEEHRAAPAKAIRELLAVIREHLLRRAIALKRFGEG